MNMWSVCLRGDCNILQWNIDWLTSPGPATSPQHLVVVSHEQWYLPAMVDLVIYHSWRSGIQKVMLVIQSCMGNTFWIILEWCFEPKIMVPIIMDIYNIQIWYYLVDNPCCFSFWARLLQGIAPIRFKILWMRWSPKGQSCEPKAIL